MKREKEHYPTQGRSYKPCEAVDLFLKGNGEPLPDFKQLTVTFLL